MFKTFQQLHNQRILHSLTFDKQLVFAFYDNIKKCLKSLKERKYKKDVKATLLTTATPFAFTQVATCN